MKTWKKLTALLLAAVMGMGLTGTAFAAEKEYADVAGHWAEAEIRLVTELGLVDGKSAGVFGPDENMTRGDLVLALYRLAKSPALDAGMGNPFTDVAEDAGCRDAILWAGSKGIVLGKSSVSFDPEGNVTRQEMAKILNLFAACSVGKKELRSRIDVLSAYADAGEVAGWAKDYMNWAVASAFITGASGGKLDPDGSVTRAQTAAILCRYMDDASTGDASKDKSRNGDSIGENELLVVSFGTSFNDNRAATIGAIESAMEKAFPDYSVRRGFTANTIIEHIYRRDGQVIDDVEEALDRAVKNGVKNLVVQPTHLMNGYEYGDLRETLEKDYSDKFESIRIGAPLLTSDGDYSAVAEAMVAATAGFDDGRTAVCYMGHGTEAAANGVYDRMQKHLTDAGHVNYFVGTVEAHPDVQDVLKLVQAGEYERVVLRPMMIVAGDHANNDMAGEDADTWKSVFAAAGYEVVTEIKGLGELEGIQRLLADHARDAEKLSETKIEKEPNPGSAKPQEPAVLADGVYTITASCKEPMFKIDSCELTVKDGKMTASLTLGSTSFDRMTAGSAASAAVSAGSAVEGVETDGKMTFTLDVEALDKELAYAAHSVRKDAWYDRTLSFDSASAVAK